MPRKSRKLTNLRAGDSAKFRKASSAQRKKVANQKKSFKSKKDKLKAVVAKIQGLLKGKKKRKFKF